MQGSLASDKGLGGVNETKCLPAAHHLCRHHGAKVPSALQGGPRSVLPDCLFCCGPSMPISAL